MRFTFMFRNLIVFVVRKNIVEGPSIDGLPLLAFQSGETMHTAALVHPSLKPTDVQE